MGEKYINRLPLPSPLLGTWPIIQARALIGNRTTDLSVHRLALNPPSHTSQGRGKSNFKGPGVCMLKNEVVHKEVGGVALCDSLLRMPAASLCTTSSLLISL